MPYVSPRKSSTTGYRSPRVRQGAAAPKKKGSPGLFGVLGAAGREAAGIITGLPGFAVEAGKFISSAPGTAGFGQRSEENERLLRAVAEDYEYRYGPLFRGDFGEFAHRAGERPLSLLLDVVPGAAVATKGLAAARVIPPAPRSITLRSPGAIAGREGAAVIERQIVGSDLGRRIRAGTDRALKRLPPEFAVLGETQRYARTLRIRELKDYTRLKLRAAPREARKHKLSNNEFVAANLLADFPLRADLDRLVAGLREVEGAGATVKLLTDPKVRKFYDAPTPKMQRFLDEEAALIARMEELLPMGAEGLEQRRFLPTLLARGARFEGDELVTPRPIPEMVAEIKAEIAVAGRPEPRYRPQKSVAETSGIRLGAGGTAPQRTPLRQNRGVLQAMGRVAYNIDTLTPQYMRTIKWASYTDRHADLVAAAKAVDTLPERHVYVRRSLGERIGYTERTAGEFERRLRETLDEVDAEPGAGSFRQSELTTTDAVDAALDAEGRRLAVPEQFAKSVVGEYRRSGKAMRYLWEKPTDVFRAIVLNLRVGWLVNNLIGNSILYAIKNAGPEGMKAYLRALADTRGAQALLPVLRNRQVRNSLSPEDMAELFPEHVSGTFFGTQTPASRIFDRKYNPTRLLRSGDIAYEQALRRAMATRLAKRNPKVKARLEAMPKETRSFGKAAREALDEADIERISKEINEALGDYFSLSAIERGGIRALSPFYAWYRAITLITLKLPLDAPGRTAILANMGKVGQEATEDWGLPWLQGSIKLNDEGLSLGTKAANPYATVTDIGRGIFADDWFAARQREGLFNPYAELYAKAITQEGPLPSRLQAGFSELLRGLPPSRLAFPEERESYTTDPRLRELLSYLGVPLRTVSPEIRARAER